MLIGVLIVTTSRSKATRQAEADADLRRLSVDARVMAVRLGEHASAAYAAGDAETVTARTRDDGVSSELRFEVPGRPVPAVRMTQRGVHTPNHPKRKQIDAYLAFKDAVGWAARAAGAELIDGPVIIDVNVHLRDRMKRRWDVDNVLKACADALNGVCYHDDKQITSATIRLYTAGRLGTDTDERTVIWVSSCG